MTSTDSSASRRQRLHPGLVRRIRFYLVFVGLAGMVAAGLIVLQNDWGWGDLRQLIEGTVDFLKNYPLLLFLGIAILPALSFPVSILCIIGGAVFSARFGSIALGTLVCVLGVWANVLWMYFVSAYPLRDLVSRLLAFFNYRVPVLNSKQGLRLTLVIRFTPGIPLMFQNYLLGVLRIPFRDYWPISLFQQGLYCGAIAATGGSLLEGKLGTIFIAVGLLIVVMVGLQVIRERMKRGDVDPSPVKDPELES